MTHSNGRWYVDGHYVKVLKPEREFLNEGAPETICEMQSSVSPEETLANQLLIAASPDLLEAVEFAMAVIQLRNEEPNAFICNGDIVAYRLMKAAIAKATGGEV